MPLKKDDRVIMEYEVKTDNGDVVESSKDNKKPFSFLIGDETVLKALEREIKHMKKGEQKTIRLKPAECYGYHNDKLILYLPRADLEGEEKLEKGMIVAVEAPEGTAEAEIIKITKKSVVIDLNHPLAGETLTYRIKIVNIIKKG